MHTIQSLEPRTLLAASFGYAAVFGDKETLDSGNAIATDSAGNTYIGGTFRGKIDVNKSNRGKHFLKTDHDHDAFLVKYDPNGKLIWSFDFGADGDETIDHLVIGPTGDVYASGQFEATVDFDPKAGVHNLTSHGKLDAFILHLTQDGNYVWAGHIGGEKDDAITALAVGPTGDIYYSGYARLRGDVDPTRAVRNIVDRGVDDTIISRIDGDNGKIKWLRIFGEDATRETIFGLTVDAGENVFAAGVFNETVQFVRNDRSFDRKAVGGYDIYFARLNSTGQFQYIRTIGGNKDESVVDMAQDPSGNLYITGNFQKTVDFAPGPTQTLLAAPGDSSAYIAKYDADANLQWGRVIGEAIVGSHSERGTIIARAIALSPGGDVYTVGDFARTIDFDPGAGLHVVDAEKSNNVPALLTQIQPSDAYIHRLDNDGNFLAVERIGGADGTILPHDIAVDSSGGINVTGAFAGFVDVNPTRGVFRRSTKEQRRDSNIFIVKLLP
jgi:hypothetical protein